MLKNLILLSAAFTFISSLSFAEAKIYTPNDFYTSEHKAAINEWKEEQKQQQEAVKKDLDNKDATPASKVNQ